MTAFRSFNDLPAELAIQVIQYCNLETCVSLGGVSSWFRQVVEDTISPLVQERVPWMYPETDGFQQNTWIGCAKTVVARRRQTGDPNKYTPLDLYTVSRVQTGLEDYIQLINRGTDIAAPKSRSMLVFSADTVRNAIKHKVWMLQRRAKETWARSLGIDDYLRATFHYIDGVTVFDNETEVLLVGSRSSTLRCSLIRRIEGVLDTANAFTFKYPYGTFLKVCLVRNAIFICFENHLFYLNHSKQHLFLVATTEKVAKHHEALVVEYNGLLWCRWDTEWLFLPLHVDLDMYNKVPANYPTLRLKFGSPNQCMVDGLVKVKRNSLLSTPFGSFVYYTRQNDTTTWVRDINESSIRIQQSRGFVGIIRGEARCWKLPRNTKTVDVYSRALRQHSLAGTHKSTFNPLI